MKRTVNLLLAASLAGCASYDYAYEYGNQSPVIPEYVLQRNAAVDAANKAYAKLQAADTADKKAYAKCIAARKAAAGRKAFAAYVDDTCEAAGKAAGYTLKLNDEYIPIKEAADYAVKLADERFAAEQAAAAERRAFIRDAALIYAVSRPVYVPPPVYVQPPLRCTWNQYGGSCY